MPLPNDPEKRKHWLERIRKLGYRNKGKKRTSEQIEAIRQRAILQWTPEARKAASERCIKQWTPEERSRVAKEHGFGKWHKGRKRRPDEIANMSAGTKASFHLRKETPEGKAKQLATVKEINQKRKGKTYEEIFGNRADDILKRQTKSRREHWAKIPKKPTKTRSIHNVDARYKDWRKAVFERDRYLCCRCGAKGSILRPHHIFEWSEFIALRYDITNGETLCVECHNEHHWNYMPKYRRKLKW